MLTGTYSPPTPKGVGVGNKLSAPGVKRGAFVIGASNTSDRRLIVKTAKDTLPTKAYLYFISFSSPILAIVMNQLNNLRIRLIPSFSFSLDNYTSFPYRYAVPVYEF
jgi:hypothetical protein